MTTATVLPTETRMLIDYLREQRRHYLALAEAARRTIIELEKEPVYNKGKSGAEADRDED
jgi:hypothetical protein